MPAGCDAERVPESGVAPVVASRTSLAQVDETARSQPGLSRRQLLRATAGSAGQASQSPLQIANTSLTQLKS